MKRQILSEEKQSAKRRKLQDGRPAQPQQDAYQAQLPELILSYKALFEALKKIQDDLQPNESYQPEMAGHYKKLLASNLGSLEYLERYLTAAERTGLQVVPLKKVRDTLIALCDGSANKIPNLSSYLQEQVIDPIWNFQYQLIKHPVAPDNNISPPGGFETLPKEINDQVVSHSDFIEPFITRAKVKLAKINQAHHKHFKSELELSAFKALIQAVMDDDRDKVTKILDGNPELLLKQPLEGQSVQSQYTWQIFFVEDPLMMAVKLKMVQMIKLLIPYYEKLGQKGIEAKDAALSKWKSHEIHEYPNPVENDFDCPGYYDTLDVLIPKEYTDYIQSLMEAFLQETEETFSITITGKARPSEKTQSKLSDLFNMLFPKSAVKLDDYVDVSLLLVAACQADVEYCKTKSPNVTELNLRIFRNRVTGLIQSALPPETAKHLCCSYLEHPEKDVYKTKLALKEHHMSTHLNLNPFYGQRSFYRQSHNSRSGLGFDFVAGLGGCLQFEWTRQNFIYFHPEWKKFIEKQQQIFEKLREPTVVSKPIIRRG